MFNNMWQENREMVFGEMIFRLKHYLKYTQDQYKFMQWALNQLEHFMKTINRILNL
jgi:hypothetical protein